MSLRNDVKFALRQMWKCPGFMAAVVLTLAIGIGANSAMFSIINGVLLQPLPYPDADRLVVVVNSYPGLGIEEGATAIPMYLDRRDGVPAFEDSALWYKVSAGITTGSKPDHYTGVRTTGSLFSTLEVAPALGRNFSAEEMVPGNERVVILSYLLWQELFNGRPNAIGSDLRIDGVQHRVIGVMHEGFAFPDREAEYFVPFAFTPQQMSDDERGNEFANTIARLAPAATVEQARAQMQAIIETTKNRLPSFRRIMDQAGMTTIVTDLRTKHADGAETLLLLLQLCVGFVLLIMCANIANLFLTRIMTRRRELAVRSAMGASRLRIARQLFTESVILSLLGGVGGILLAFVSLNVFGASGIVDASSIFDIEMDSNVLLATFAVSLAAGLLFGLFPVVSAWRGRTADVLKEGSRGMSSGRGARLSRNALVIGQLTLAVALLVSAGLLIRSFVSLQSVDPGFNETGVLSARISLPDSRYPNVRSVHNFQQRLHRAVDGLPGVTASAMAQAVPFGNSSSLSSYGIRGMESAAGRPVLNAHRSAVSGDYFKAMQINVLKGRSFNARDRMDTRHVAVIDEVLANKYFLNSDPLGRQITFDVDGDDPNYRTIVGVVNSVKHFSMNDEMDKEAIYLPLSQSYQPDFYVLLRSNSNPDLLTAPLRDALLRLDPELPAYDIQALHARIDESLQGTRMPMTLLAVFAGVALLLAGIGLYGLLAFSVAQRTGEMGVRMALGADRARVMKLILGEGSRLILAGLGMGLLLALLLGLGLRSMLFGVGAADPLVYLSAVALLSLIAVAACAIPSWRAARVNPIDALREE